MITIIKTRVTEDKAVVLLMFLFMISALFMSFGANGALINFDEAIDGDLSNSASGTGTHFIIDTAGNNHWSGSGSIVFTSTSMAIDLNRFAFTVVDGLEITGVYFGLSNTNIGNRSQLEHAIYSRSVPAMSNKEWNTFYDNSGTAIGLPVPALTPVYPFASGDYLFYAQYWGADRSNSSWNWNVEIITSSISTVPEPSILLLFGAGILGLGFVPRRKKS